MDKKIITLKICFLIFFSCNSQVSKTEKDNIVLYDIIFTSGFDSDEIIFTINNEKIIKSVLMSNKSDGVTSLGYQIITEENSIILISGKGEKFRIKNEGNIILSVKHKGKNYNFRPERKMGRYILIELKKDIIKYNQQKEKPLFD